MHTRRIFPLRAAFWMALMAVVVGNRGHVTLESSSAGLWLWRAWGQKVQLAWHLPALYVIK
jgi:hypothetical protein